MSAKTQWAIAERIQRDWGSTVGTVLIVVGLITVLVNTGTAYSVGWLTLGATLALIGAAGRIEAAIRARS